MTSYQATAGQRGIVAMPGDLRDLFRVRDLDLSGRCLAVGRGDVEAQYRRGSVRGGCAAGTDGRGEIEVFLT